MKDEITTYGPQLPPGGILGMLKGKPDYARGSTFCCSTSTRLIEYDIGKRLKCNRFFHSSGGLSFNRLITIEYVPQLWKRPPEYDVGNHECRWSRLLSRAVPSQQPDEGSNVLHFSQKGMIRNECRDPIDPGGGIFMNTKKSWLNAGGSYPILWPWRGSNDPPWPIQCGYEIAAANDFAEPSLSRRIRNGPPGFYYPPSGWKDPLSDRSVSDWEITMVYSVRRSSQRWKGVCSLSLTMRSMESEAENRFCLSPRNGVNHELIMLRLDSQVKRK